MKNNTARPVASMDPARSRAAADRRAKRSNDEAQARLRAITPGVATPATAMRPWSRTAVPSNR